MDMDMDNITLSADLASGETIDMSKTCCSDRSIVETLDQIARFLRAIGYDWVETVQVTATDSDGTVVIHSSDEFLFVDSIGDCEGSA